MAREKIQKDKKKNIKDENNLMKGFFGTIKVEKHYLNRYETLDDLKNDIKEYIRFYNEERLQKI